jgi:hypothetical protein
MLEEHLQFRPSGRMRDEHGKRMQMEQRADEGDADAATLVRGLLRLAAIQLLERFTDLFDNVVADVVLTLSHVGSDASQFRSGSRWASVRRTLSQRATKRAAICSSHNAKCIWAALRSALQTGRHVSLSADAVTAVDASLVLLKGSLRLQMPDDSEAAAPQRLQQSAVRTAHAPCILVWSDFDNERGSTLVVQAGKVSHL